ncbi:hypothetical protein SAMN06265360_11945 [Haloechinothrix alba]|uniref:Lipoprotein n=1 Tax=Haloechinothrix alba TaxID=664784 RepID=A0A238Z664_9PSEU|nr:hypothetical protein [Haloechinothrix alba]SNR78438.1 hypothetical protein SAMN06265360_11945 [Haloechinothrix alba]
MHTTQRSSARRARGIRAAALAVTCGLLLGACADVEGQGDALQVVDDPEAVGPVDSPEQTSEPDGTVIDVPAGVSDVAVHAESGTLAAALTAGGDAGAAVLLYPLDDLPEPLREIAVPGDVEQLVPGENAFLATVPGQDELLHLSPEGGVVGRTGIEGAPAGVTEHGDSRIVASRERAEVDVFEHEQRTASIGDDIASADRVISTGDAVVVLDRLRSAVFEVDLEERDIGLGLRAGQGATNATADGFGRVLVTDTLSDGLLAFAADPLVLVQRYPVHGGIYAIAYDAERDLAWVTLTARNEVVGFDVAGGQPEEIHRFDTVRQPNSVTVENQDGRVVVGSAAGEGIQVIEP